MRETQAGVPTQSTMLADARARREHERPSQLTGFPPDLLAQCAGRLRAGALLYAFVFFMAIETLIHHTQTLPVPPSQRTELPIPLLLDELILACLQKNADDRPASADVLLARLADIKTDAEWTPERSLQWWELRSPRKAPMA